MNIFNERVVSYFIVHVLALNGKELKNFDNEKKSLSFNIFMILLIG